MDSLCPKIGDSLTKDILAKGVLAWVVSSSVPLPF